jgi:hypothetical protein
VTKVGFTDALVFDLPSYVCMFANYRVNFVGQFTWVKLVFLEALLRPVEQLDKLTPRGKSRLLRGNRVPIIMGV